MITYGIEMNGDRVSLITYTDKDPQNPQETGRTTHCSIPDALKHLLHQLPKEKRL